MTYLIRVAIGVLGGAGTVAAYHQTRDPILTAIVAFVVIAAFIAAYLLNVSLTTDRSSRASSASNMRRNN